MSLPTVIATTESNQQPSLGAHLGAAVDGLSKRELLEPTLLLGAGYLALPFLLRQTLLLLAPLLVLCGVAPDHFVSKRKGAPRVLPE